MKAQLTLDLVEEPEPGRFLCPGAMVLPGFALTYVDALLLDLRRIVAAAPFRHLITPGGHRMSVAMTNCGSFGWVSDRSGYRYDRLDPLTGKRWPPLPESFLRLAEEAGNAAGFPGFLPDVCLINRYEPGARLTLHQDKGERGLVNPIVSVSLGLPAVFLFGGMDRTDRPLRIPLRHGDVTVWGGPARLRYHGVLPIKQGHHPVLGGQRLNLTFRKAG